MATRNQRACAVGVLRRRGVSMATVRRFQRTSPETVDRYVREFFCADPIEDFLSALPPGRLVPQLRTAIYKVRPWLDGKTSFQQAVREFPQGEFGATIMFWLGVWMLGVGSDSVTADAVRAFAQQAKMGASYSDGELADEKDLLLPIWRIRTCLNSRNYAARLADDVWRAVLEVAPGRGQLSANGVRRIHRRLSETMNGDMVYADPCATADSTFGRYIPFPKGWSDDSDKG